MRFMINYLLKDQELRLLQNIQVLHQQVTSASTGGMNPVMANALMYFSQSADDGTMGLLQCAVGQEVESGQLWRPKGMTGLAVSIPPEPLLTDLIAKETLWKLSCSAIGSDWQL
mmetsp:Transcript_733/g.1329  ORF Transcript_733/g.1329 Transcript_733/m.1329 type:complete len:114 (-) Transcript_733:328-669(-)